ncbi:uncharacterized protein PADG_04045 [Paracoccidioides brasiliensis Pb18]|uniref:Uncharacterized protein n=1 Tax=Paracoccidioides brasiliensis (strain Pb18) TaxID=502780 RepID=C1G9V9_PARBD|nr:uncharacterized protein PADG_04045 [Paracoccidioides brasiliensis Pb18]EEH47961.2 hypothetical protein PADG_04045 [Paracoccidioides brasiliensis Pb18]
MDTWEYIRDVRQKVTLSSRGRTELRKGPEGSNQATRPTGSLFPGQVMLGLRAHGRD